MYLTIRDAVVRRPRRRRGAVRVPATVLLLGFTSLFTDISSEMVASVLPLYLTIELSFSALQFGLYDGLSQAVQAVVRIGGGAAADRRSSYKGLAMVGYGTSAVTRIAILLTGGAFLPTTGVLLADRVGKGIRTAPRDAMISLASPKSILGRSFGVHRMLDGIGALLGPLVAFAILAALPDAYRTVFVVSFAFAMVGFAILALFVDRQVATPNRSMRFRRAIAEDLVHRPHLRRITLVAALLGALTISDAFVFLSVRRVTEIRLEFFPLLFTGTAVVYLICAVPMGRLADRFGHRHVFFFGYATLALVYALLLRPLPGVFGPLSVVGGLGLFYASTDGVLMAFASRFLGTDARATGLAIVATGAAFGRFVASILFGALWSAFGPDDAIMMFMLALPVVIAVAWVTTSRAVGPPPPEPHVIESVDAQEATPEP